MTQGQCPEQPNPVRRWKWTTLLLVVAILFAQVAVVSAYKHGGEVRLQNRFEAAEELA